MTHLYALANPEKQKQYRQKAHLQAQKRNKEIVIAAKQKPCVDCGKSYPSFVMDFHHRTDKQFQIGKYSSIAPSAKRLRAEIAKCDVICANCHRIRTHA
jgi:hypothetical protein